MKSIYLNHFARAFISLAALLEFSAPAQSSAAPVAMPRRPSIIFIQCDGLGYGDLSCYGQTKFQTPNIDQLAAGGIRFTNYSAAGASSPSQAALLLGKNPAPLRQRADADISLAADEITVAQVLKNSGYHTGLIGEWNLDDENSSGVPWKQGFDEFAGYLDHAGTNHFYADYVFRYAPRNFLSATNDGPKSFVGREMIYRNTGGKKNEYIPDLLAQAALNFVKKNQPDPFNRHRPFFLLLNYEIPDGKIEVPTDAPFSEEAWPQPEKDRAALISRLDGYVGGLREQLRKIGMTNNVVIFLSSSSGPKKTAEIDPAFFHSNISSNDFRVPFIVHCPGKIPAGQISGAKVAPQDFLPTAAAIALTPAPTNIDGVSLLPELSGREK
ncbi:MAG TPA: sulfatase-like hydrolase/transferase [Verrucomicrobiae bacterium]|nr:sulfatase-like hydrolase/transferase [Verrucomicrobiae bacterium]